MGTSTTGEGRQKGKASNKVASTLAAAPKLLLLRQKLSHKATEEPNFRFYSLYGHICREDVFWAAWCRVAENDGSPGVDGVSIEDIERGDVMAYLDNIRKSLIEGTYRPKPVKREYIPKPDGRLRPLGIPVVDDRVVQMATLLILEPIFEVDFLDCSHGFRPGKNAHQAIQKIQGHLKEGYTTVYDADLKGYFDSIPHDKLMKCLEKRIADRKVLNLIRMWLNSPIQEPPSKEGGSPQLVRSTQGTPQGGVISPLLANIFLHWFDKVFHRKDGPYHTANAKLVRYADDFVVMTKGASEDTVQFIESKIEGWLGLTINREKTKVFDVSKERTLLNFLGFSTSKRKSKFRSSTYWHLCPSRKAISKFKEKLHDLTDRKRCFLSVKDFIRKINMTRAGWMNYFKIGYPSEAIDEIEHYTRIRIIDHLKRRSQRGYKLSEGQTWYNELKDLGLQRMRCYV